MTPQEEATNEASSSTASNKGRREYTVTSLDDNETYRLELFPSENVTVTDGVVTFEDANDDNLADDGG